jgi:hypothetical protein
MKVSPKFIRLEQDGLVAFVRADTITTIEAMSVSVPGKSSFRTTVTCASATKTYGVYTTMSPEEVIALIEYEESNKA